MVLFNYSTRELTAKVVYYGPGLCGKTTNLQYIYDNLPGNAKGKMLSLATKTDRTLFFDFLPIDLGEIRGMRTRIQLYTVPGQVFYNETRRLVLKGADGVVFVADSQKQMMEANQDSFRNLEENLRAHAMKLSDLPLVLQFNKRDLPGVGSIEDLNTSLNKHNAPFYESVATTGIGVQDTLKAITKLVLLHLTKKYDVRRPGQVVVPAGADSSASAPGTASSTAPFAASGTPKAQALPSAARSGHAGSSQPRPAPAAAAAILGAMPVAAGARPRSVSAVATDEEIVDLVDVIEEPASTFQEVTDEAELFALEEEQGVESLEVKRPAAAPSRKQPLGSSVSTAKERGREIPVQVSTSSETGPGFTLHEVNEDDEMFAGGPQVARLDATQEAEVVVPIEVQAGASKRRFKLTVRLSLSEIGERKH